MRWWDLCRGLFERTLQNDELRTVITTADVSASGPVIGVEVNLAWRFTSLDERGGCAKPCGGCANKAAVIMPQTRHAKPAATVFPAIAAVTAWAVGVTTAARSGDTLPRTLNSLTAAGWDDWKIFSEPGAPLSVPASVVVQRPATIAAARFDTRDSGGRFGAWRHFVQTLADLLAWKPNADAILIVQDDVVFARDVRAFLEREIWPANDCGAVSVYSSQAYERADQAAFEWLPIDSRLLVGALAFAFPRSVAEQILMLPIASEWRGSVRLDGEPDPVKKKCVDGFVGVALRELGRRAYYPSRSLAQHIGDNSSIGNGANSGLRRSVAFIGEDRSAFELPGVVAKPVEVAREKLPVDRGGPEMDFRVNHFTRQAGGKLAVLTTHFNPAGFRAIEMNCDRFLRSMDRQGADVFLAALVFDDQPEREFAACHHGSLQVERFRTNSDLGSLWQKERLLNELLDRLPAEYDRVAWIDADIVLPDWWLLSAGEGLNEFGVVQLFDEVWQETPAGVAELITKPSIGRGWSIHDPNYCRLDRYHPGFAWASRREPLEAAGGFLDTNITGGGDGLMAVGFVGGRVRIMDAMNAAWRVSVEQWQRAATRAFRGSLDYCSLDAQHMYHGSRANRRYVDRWVWLAEWRFNPAVDLVVVDGVWNWSERAAESKRDLIELVRKYFPSRREDDGLRTVMQTTERAA